MSPYITKAMKHSDNILRPYYRDPINGFLFTKQGVAMEQTTNLTGRKSRPEIHSICLGDESWEQAKEIAKMECRSVSSLIRNAINQLSKKKKKQELSSS